MVFHVLAATVRANMKFSNDFLFTGVVALSSIRLVIAVPAGPPLSYSPVGCYSDAVAPKRTLEGPLVDLLKNGNSPLNCAQACSNLGWPLAGVENGGYVTSKVLAVLVK